MEIFFSLIAHSGSHTVHPSNEVCLSFVQIVIDFTTVQSLYKAMFESIGMDRFISEKCYKWTFLEKELLENDHFMVIFL